MDVTFFSNGTNNFSNASVFKGSRIFVTDKRTFFYIEMVSPDSVDREMTNRIIWAE